MRHLWVAGAAVAVLAGAPKSSAAQLDFPPMVGARIPLAPTPVPGLGQAYLTYEIHLTSFNPVDLQLVRLEVYLDRQTNPVASYRGAELAKMLLGSSGLLRPGGADVIYLWVKLDPTARPTSVRNVLGFEAGGREATIETSIEVRPAGEAVVLGPPLRGGPWVVAFGPANDNGHRRSIVPIHGRAAVVQRYAVDYYKVDREGHLFHGDSAKTTDYYAYGQDVLAVADAAVAVAHDGQAENDFPSADQRKVPINLGTIGGNYVMLDLGRGRYAFYAHLKTGSIRVKPGDRVKKGQVIGLLGLSGNTPAPHLHLHVGDTTEPIGSEGLPYLFERFTVVGECNSPDQMWGWFNRCDFGTPDVRRGEIPLAWKLIEF